MKVRIHAAALLLLASVTGPLMAQQPPRPRAGGEASDSMRLRMLNVEAALRFKQDLKLTDSQVSQLDAIRKEIVADRQAQARDMIDTESRIAAGMLSPEDAHKQFEGKGEAMRETMRQRHDRIAKILTPEQQDKLELQARRAMMQRMRGPMGHGAPGPGSMGRGRMRPRGMAPGEMGPGWAPRGRMAPWLGERGRMGSRHGIMPPPWWDGF